MQIRVNGLKIDRLSPFEDDRGRFVCVTPSNLAEMHSQYPEVGFSVTRKNVLRGLHGSNTSSKLITLVNGKVFWVCVDLESCLGLGFLRFGLLGMLLTTFKSSFRMVWLSDFMFSL